MFTTFKVARKIFGFFRNFISFWVLKFSKRTPTSCRELQEVSEDVRVCATEVFNHLKHPLTSSDTSCNSRQLRVGVLFENTQNEIKISEEEAKNFSGKPLNVVNIESYLEPISAGAPNLQDLPFDISKHVYAKSDVATEMLDRLKKDVLDYKDKEKDKTVLRLKRKNISSFLAELQTLITQLTKWKQEDAKCVEEIVKLVKEISNRVQLHEDEKNIKKYLFLLDQISAETPEIDIKFVTGQILSKKAVDDLKKANPFMENPEQEFREGIGYPIDSCVPPEKNLIAKL